MATATQNWALHGIRARTSSKSAYHGPDPVKVAEQLETLKNWAKQGAQAFSSQCFWINRKKTEGIDRRDILANNTRQWNRRLVPFVHNAMQQSLDANMGKRNVILKYRQAGCTTYGIIERLLKPAILEPGTNCMLISQDNSYAVQHFGILQRAFQYFAVVDPFSPNRGNEFASELKRNLLHIRYTNRKEIVFDQLDSRVLIESAEKPEAGQGLTLQHVWCTEVARWQGNPEETLANLKEAIPDDGTLDLDSTANGWGGYFFQECMRSREWNKILLDGRAAEEPDKEAEFKYHFFYWWMHEEYKLDKGVDPDTLTDTETKLIKAYGLSLEQIAWRRMKIRSLRYEFAEKYAEDDLTCFLTSGQQFFDPEVLKERQLELMPIQPLEKYKKLEIYKRRVKGRRYIIGADVAAGLPTESGDPDYSAAVVIDMETGEEMAAYHARLPEEEYAQELAHLGELYNNALIGVERLGYGGTTIVTLEVACQYMNIFKYKDWWRRDRKLVEFPGVPMNTRTRPIALNRVRYFVRTTPWLIHDRAFIEEAMAFVINDKGKPCAQAGWHDDRVMCRAIAHLVRSIQLGWLDPASIPSERYSQTPQEFAEEDGGEEVDETEQ